MTSSASPAVEVDAGATPAWFALRRSDSCLIALTCLFLLILGWTHLPPGVCFDDPGDLQTACATLGIAHPPGYVGYSFVGWLLCRVFFFAEPAWVVSVACLLCMVTSAAILIVLLTRTGLHVLAACSTAVLLAAHNSIWANMVVPEVYAPSLLLLSGSTYFVVKYCARRQRIDLLVAAALFGFLIVSRPPTLLMLPGPAAALWMARRRQGSERCFSIGGASLVLSAFLLPIVCTVVLAWRLDHPDTDYNVIQQHAESEGGIPLTAESTVDHVRRVVWLLSGEKFRRFLGASKYELRTKRRWLLRKLHIFEMPRWIIVALLAAVGSAAIAKLGSERLLVMIGILAGATAYVMGYGVRGLAADLCPILFAGGFILACAFLPIFPRELSYSRRVAAWILFIGSCTGVGYRTLTRHWDFARGADATTYLMEIDVATLPADTVIVSQKPEASPLWYARSVTHQRFDVRIVIAPRVMWDDIVLSYLGQFVLYTQQSAPLPDGWALQPYRNLRRVVPKASR